MLNQHFGSCIWCYFRKLRHQNWLSFWIDWSFICIVIIARQICECDAWEYMETYVSLENFLYKLEFRTFSGNCNLASLERRTSPTTLTFDCLVRYKFVCLNFCLSYEWWSSIINEENHYQLQMKKQTNKMPKASWSHKVYKMKRTTEWKHKCVCVWIESMFCKLVTKEVQINYFSSSIHK